MYIGHVGVALAAKRARRSIGLLVLLIATYTPDWIDTGLCVAGQYNPDGMLSHSIPAVLLFAMLGFVVYAAATRDWIGALIIASVIVSHFLLDLVTGYKPTWPGGRMIGLRLYDRPVIDFLAEGIVICIGAVLYSRTLPPRERPLADLALMAGSLLVLQMSIDVAHLLMATLPKC